MEAWRRVWRVFMDHISTPGLETLAEGLRGDVFREMLVEVDAELNKRRVL